MIVCRKGGVVLVFLIILGAVLLGIMLFLCIPVSVCAQYDETFEVKAKFLFFDFSVIPSKEKKKKPEKTKKNTKKDDENKVEKSTTAKKNKNNVFLEFYYNSGFAQTVKLINEVANIIKKYLNSLFVRHLVVSEIYLDMIVAGEDSADTAEKFGKISAALYPSLAFLHSKLKIKNRDINVRPDFLAQNSAAKFRVKFRIKPFWLLNCSIYAGLKLLWKFIKVLCVNNNAKKVKQKYVKKSDRER